MATSLHDVTAWFHALDPLAARVLCAAGVFGVEFWRGGVCALLPELSPDDIDRTLNALHDDGTLARRPTSRFAGEETWSFRDPRRASLTAAQLDPTARAVAHRRAGAWLEDAGELDASAVASHLLRGDRAHDAGTWCAEAARSALGERDYDGALDWSERAVNAGVDATTEASMRLLQTGVHDARGAIEEAERCARCAWYVAPAESMEWFRAAASIAVLSARMLRPDPFGHLEPAIRAALNHDNGIAPAGLALAVLPMLQMGQYGLADMVIARLEEILASGEHPEPTFPARVYAARALRAGYGDDPTGSMRESERAARAYESLNEPRFALHLWNNYGFSQVCVGDGAGAEKTLRGLIQRASSLDLQRIVAAGQLNLGPALALLGRHDEACAIERAVIDVANSLGDAHMAAMAGLYLARAQLGLGDPQAALAAVDPCMAVVASQPGARVLSLAVRAASLMGLGRAVEALDASNEGARVLRTVGTVEEGDALVRLVQVEARAGLGDSDGARTALGHAYARLCERASQVESEASREMFLREVPEHARTVTLAAQAGLAR